MLSSEEKEKLEQEFQYVLDNIVSKIKGETATAIVVSEQSMILLFKKLMLKIEKQSKEIEILNENMNLLREQNISYKQSIHGLKEINKIINKKWEHKIKAKIEEIDKEIKVKREIAKNPMDRVAGRLLTDSIVELEKTKKVLQSLLEKE